jgi:hypothetical protein
MSFNLQPEENTAFPALIFKKLTKLTNTVHIPSAELNTNRTINMKNSEQN